MVSTIRRLFLALSFSPSISLCPDIFSFQTMFLWFLCHFTRLVTWRQVACSAARLGANSFPFLTGQSLAALTIDLVVGSFIIHAVCMKCNFIGSLREREYTQITRRGDIQLCAFLSHFLTRLSHQTNRVCVCFSSVSNSDFFMIRFKFCLFLKLKIKTTCKGMKRKGDGFSLNFSLCVPLIKNHRCLALQRSSLVLIN